MKFIVVLLTLVSCTYSMLQPKCVVNPREHRWPDVGKICHESLEYNE
jgi:hypothetical protein